MGQKKKDTYKGNTKNVIYPMTRQNCQEVIFPKVKKACGIDFKFGLHSLRKTFGYHAWKQGASSALLVTIFNHSSFHITKRYLGIEQDDKDQIFKKIKL